ncbi:Protein JTB [Toxocara canis]|uniref:Protein JTB n=1 Tax=Toxocara canis TaxID=6265 RepID=A0A0B2UYB7_TOXCA|nr:Protein JTB [Toxocara canis]
MIESCSFRRMIFCIVPFSIISALVFLIESRLEESISSGDTVLKKLVVWRSSEVTDYPISSANVSHPRNVALTTVHKVPAVSESSLVNDSSEPSSALCYMNEPFTVIEECARCSSFELDALRAGYCLESGYYDRLNCTSSGRIGLRPCYSRGDYASSRLNRVMLFWILMAVASYAFVSWRRGILDRRAYQRIQQQLGS